MCGYAESMIAAEHSRQEAEYEAEQQRRDAIVARYNKRLQDGKDIDGKAITYEVIEEHRKAMVELVNKAMDAGDPVNVVTINYGEGDAATYGNIGTMPTEEHLALLFAILAQQQGGEPVNGVVLN